MIDVYRQCTYKRNAEARSRNHCCHGKAISITYSECVFVALVVQHTKRMCCIILPSVDCLTVPYFTTLYHKRHDFRKNRTSNWTQNVCFRFPYSLVWHISHSKKKWARYDRTCTVPVCMYSTGYCCQIVMDLAIYRQILEKYPNIKFHGKAYRGSWVVACGRTDRRADMTKLNLIERTNKMGPCSRIYYSNVS